MRYYISEWKGRKMGGVFQPAALQSVLRKRCFSGSLLCLWIGVERARNGHVVPYYYEKTTKKEKTQNHKAVCKYWKLLR